MTGTSAGSLGVDGATDPSQLFVINLCSSTSPMALAHPSSPELKRYTFYVSRQREEGRERFRLHMGYFESQGEAETLLAAVRDVYPAAWAGPAPTVGVPRRGRIAPVKLAAAVVRAAAAPVQPTVAPSAPAPAPVAVAAVAAPVVPPAPPSEDDQFVATMTNVRDVLAHLSEDTNLTVPANATPPVVQPVAKIEPPRLNKPAATQPAAASLSPKQTMELLEPPVPAPARPAAPVAPAQRAAAAAAKPVTKAPAALPVSAEPLTSPYAGLENEPVVRVVTPEDTQSLTDIRLDAQNNAPPCFAVQLVWAVAPIDAASLPHLAIFDAYTLYNVEGNRQGRKWYGLRLGFFTDPNSATQVANYVRSDYKSVAIVPVATKERDHASGGAAESKHEAQRLGDAKAPMKPAAELDGSREMLDGFELLADDRPAPAKRDLDDMPAANGAAKAKVQAAGTPGAAAAARAVPVAKPVAAAATPVKVAGKAAGKRVMVRKRADAPLQRTPHGAPQPMESTLEILGASTLSIDDGRAIINDSGVRKPIKKPPNKFSKLLSRLSGN